VMCKIGLVAPGKFHARGFHPTALCSTFGAASAAGKLYALEPAQWSDAFGLCGSQSSGIIEYLADGTWTKRLHPGWSAHGGVIPCCWRGKDFAARLPCSKASTAFIALLGEPTNTPSKN
jgi:2-methylcitrate dehydratase PrpD